MRALYHACGITIFLLPHSIVNGIERGLPRWWIAFMLVAWSLCVIAVIIETVREHERDQ